MSKREDPQALVSSQAPSAAGSSVGLVVVSSDGNPGNDFLQEEPPFRLCHGAEHRLEVRAPDGSTWVGQPLSLHFISAEETPSRYGLSASPQFVTDTVDEDAAYRALPAAGIQWQLTAAITDTVMSGAMKLGLGSYWQAPKYPFDAQIGDYWYAITNLAWDGKVPIVEGGKPVTFTATVRSAFDRQRPVEGAMVKWTAGKREFTAEKTDADGLSRVEYLPQADDIEGGKVTFTAACTDAFNHTTIQPRELRAFVKAPWGELLTMVLKEEDGSVVKPTPLGMRLKRELKHTLTLTPVEGDDYFLEHEITLDWFEGSEKLGIDFTPKTARKMTAAGLSWTITGGSESGEFVLQAWSQALGQEVPFVLPGVQMSANLADEAELEVEVNVDGVPPIFQRGVEKPVCIVPKAGSPLGRMKLDATLKFVRLSNDIPATQIPADPPYNTPSAVTDRGALWTLKGSTGGDSGQFSLQVEMPGFTTPLMLDRGLMMSSVLGDEAQVLIDGKLLGDQSLILWRRETHTITLLPNAKIKSPLGKTTLKGELTFNKGSLEADKVVATPAYENKRTIPADGLSWTLRGEEVSGTFGLYFKVAGFKDPLGIPALLLSADIRKEADVTVEGMKLGDTILFARNQAHVLSIVPKKGSPLGIRDFFECWLTFNKGSLTEDKVVALPNYTEHHALTGDGLKWTLTGANISGSFGLTVNVTRFKDPVSMPALLLSADIREEADITVDGNKQTDVVLFRKQPSVLKVVPKKGSPLAIRDFFDCKLSFVPGSLTSDKVAATPKYEQARAMIAGGLEWELKGGEYSGDCNLGIHIAGFAEPASFAYVALMSSQLGDEVDVKFDAEDMVLPLILRRKKPRKVKITPKSGSPLVRMNGQCKMTFTSGSLTADKVTASPAYNSERPMTASGLEWTLTGADVSGTFGLNFHMTRLQALALSNAALLSQNLLDEVDVTLDGEAPTNPMIFRRGAGRKIKVKPKPGSPLLLNNGDCSISYWNDSGVPAGKVTANPAFANKRQMVANGLEWTVTGKDVSGTFKLNVHMEKYTGFTSKEAALLAKNLIDEVDVTINGGPVHIPMVLRLSSVNTLKLMPKSGSPLARVPGKYKMTITEDSLTARSMRVDPAFNNERELNAGKLEWRIDQFSTQGQCFLNLHMTAFADNEKIAIQTAVLAKTNKVGDKEDPNALLVDQQ